MADTIEYVDYGVAGEYGPFGKVVARSEVGTLTEEEVEREVKAMKAILGDHVATREVEIVGAIQGVGR